jgi:hypothetical protein
MLEGRLVNTSLMGSNLTAQVVGGSPQGGVLSPLLWNLVVDRLLVITNDLGFRTFGYADDIVIIVQGKFEHTVRELMQSALDAVVNWVVKEGLNINPHKATIVSFTNRRIVRDSRPITLLGKELVMMGEVKYLGVILDSKLNWNHHLQKIIRKSMTTFTVVRRMYGKRWGLRPSMLHWLYTRVIRPSILYAALVWWPKVKQKSTKNQLGRIQRMACLAITGAMKSTPTAAMEVLLNLTPLDLLIRAEARMALYTLNIIEQPNIPKTEAGMLNIWRKVGNPVLEMRSDHITPVYYYTKNYMVNINQEFWRNKDPRLPRDALFWFTDGSRDGSWTGSGIQGIRPEKGLFLSG